MDVGFSTRSLECGAECLLAFWILAAFVHDSFWTNAWYLPGSSDRYVYLRERVFLLERVGLGGISNNLVLTMGLIDWSFWAYAGNPKLYSIFHVYSNSTLSIKQCCVLRTSHFNVHIKRGPAVFSPVYLEFVEWFALRILVIAPMFVCLFGNGLADSVPEPLRNWSNIVVSQA